MERSLRNVLVNSTLAFVSAFIITTILHELGHFISYIVFGKSPALFHNYVQNLDQVLTIQAKVISALAGPFVSLIQGLGFALVVSKRRGNSPTDLFFLWLALLGFVNFFGYLVMTPLSITGDTGKVAHLLNIDYSIRIIIAIVGFGSLVWIIRKIGRNFSNFIPSQHDLQWRKSYLYRLMPLPILIGSVANTLLAFPVVALVNIIYPATSSYVIMVAFNVVLGSFNSQITKPQLEDTIIKGLVLLTAFSIFLNRLLALGAT